MDGKCYGFESLIDGSALTKDQHKLAVEHAESENKSWLRPERQT